MGESGPFEHYLELFAVTNKTTSFVGDTKDLPPGLLGIATFILDVTSITGAGGTANVFVQTTYDEGSTWIDLCAFPQFTTAGGADKKLMTLSLPVLDALTRATASFDDQDAAMTADTVRAAVLGTRIRGKVTLASATDFDATLEGVLR